MDFEYEEQYNKIKDKLVPYIVDMIDSYDEMETFNRIVFMDSSNNPVMLYVGYDEKNGEIYMDGDFNDEMYKIFPHPIWSIHGKYIMADVFNYFYPDLNVVDSRVAYIT